MPTGFAGAEEGAVEVYVEDLFPVGVGVVCGGDVLADAGGGDEDVDFAKVGDCLGEAGLDGGLGGDVDGDADHFRNVGAVGEEGEGGGDVGVGEELGADGFDGGEAVGEGEVCYDAVAAGGDEGEEEFTAEAPRGAGNCGVVSLCSMTQAGM